MLGKRRRFQLLLLTMVLVLFACSPSETTDPLPAETTDPTNDATDTRTETTNSPPVTVDREAWEWKPQVFAPPSGPYEVVWPGDDVEGLVAGASPGTVFLFQPGRYEGVSVQAKDGMVFVAEPGVVFDGLDEVAFAFYGTTSNVTVRGFVVEGYAAEFQQSTIGFGGGTAWVIEGNEVRFNKSGGIHLQPGGSSVIRGNYVHHNGRIGISGQGAGHLIEDNVIAHNNTAGHPWKTGTAEAGGTKFVRTTDLVVKNNYVHDNDGPGLWTDGRNRNALIVGNLVEENTGPGIFHEISYSATITDNKVYRNQYVGIWISASSDVEVKNNEVVDNLNGGIAASQDDRGDGFHIENLWVHDNYIQMVTPSDDFWGWNGLQQQVGDDTYFSTRNNRWDHNTYHIPTGLENPFKWMNSRQTIQQWRDHGHDTNSTFN